MNCPDCKSELVKVFQDGKTPLNHLQWEMVRLGDYYCPKCIDNNMFTVKFFRTAQVLPKHDYQCPVCETLINADKDRLVRA